MSLNRNNVKVEYQRLSRVPIDFSKTYHLGDILKWDATNHVAVPVEAADTNNASVAAAIIGVGLDAQPIPSLNQNLENPRMNVCSKGLVELTVEDNSTYYPGDYVGIGTDPQKIVRAAGSSSVAMGVVAPENGFPVVSGVATGITAVANVTKLLIYLKPQYTQLLPF